MADTELEQANTSQHLAILRNQGIVESRRDGPRTMYSIKRPEVAEILALVSTALMPSCKKARQCFRPYLEREEPIHRPRGAQKADVDPIPAKGGDIMRIEVYGPGCAKCQITAEVIRKVAEDMGVAVRVINQAAVIVTVAVTLADELVGVICRASDDSEVTCSEEVLETPGGSPRHHLDTDNLYRQTQRRLSAHGQGGPTAARRG